MRPTTELKTEHKAVKLALRILDKMRKGLEDGDDVSPDDLQSIVGFIQLFVGKCHHEKEEKVFYSVMGKIEMTKKKGLVAVMLTEHDLGREYTKKMSEGVKKYKQGDADGSFIIIENAKSYSSLLRQHIREEDNILYPIVEAKISKQKQIEILKKFDAIERNAIGQGKHEELHRMLKGLERIYL